jgi:hypothetical protein
LPADTHIFFPKGFFQMTVKDSVHQLLPSGHTPPINAQNLRDAMDLVIDYVPTVAGTGGGGGGSVVTGNAATFDTVATLQASTVDPAINYVRTAGYYSVGDLGGAAYRRKATGETAYELDRTSNGGTVHWELIPERYEIWHGQAGGQGASRYDVQDNDSYPAWRAIDKFAKAKGLIGFSYRFPSNVFFFSKAIHLKRINYKIIGTHGGNANSNGSLLRFKSGQSGIITNYKWGAGHDYSIAIPNFGINLGGGNYVATGTGANDGNVYRCVQAGVSPPTGAASLTSTTPGVDIPWGSAIMRYEGNIITDPVPGGGTMDYDCGGDDNSSAGDCVMENLELWGWFDPRAVAQTTNPNWGLWKKNNAGIVMRTRARVSNCWTLGFNGHGLAIVADGDTDLMGPGNVNGWYVTHLSSYYNGKDGIHVGYSDANAGSAYQIDVSSNNRWGIADWCFLTNLWCGVQSAYDNRGYFNTRQYYDMCQYNGWIYLSRLPILGSDNWPAYKNEVPGGSNNAWIRYYKSFPNLVNAQMNPTASTSTTITLGSVVAGKQSFDAAGAVSGNSYFYSIVDGANYEYGSGQYYPAGSGGYSSPTVTRGQVIGQGFVGGVTASSTTQSNGAPGFITPSGSAVVTLITQVQDYENAPYWNPYQTFEPGGCFSTNNVNARTIWLGPYIEGGTPPAQWSYPTLVLGGIMGDAYDETRGATIFTENRWTTLSTQTQTQCDDGTFPKFQVSINGTASVFSWTDYNGSTLALRQEATGSGPAGYSGGDTVIDVTQFGIGNGGSPYLRFRTGGAHTFGRTGNDWTNIKATHVSALVVGDGGQTDGRLVTYGSAAPTSGERARGEIVYNIAPSAGGKVGWVCTAAGTPGTWKAFGVIDA